MRPIIVGANILFAAFIKDGLTRELILDGGLDLRTPPWIWAELASHHGTLRRKTGLPAAALDELFLQLRARIVDVPAAAIEARRQEALQRTRRPGRKDAPYVAAALAVEGALWAPDGALAKPCRVPVVTTAGLAAGRI